MTLITDDDVFFDLSDDGDLWFYPNVYSYVSGKYKLCLELPVTCRAVKLARAVVRVGCRRV